MASATNIYAAYIGYLAAAIMIFSLRPPRQAVLLTCMLGWILLPVGAYPADAIQTEALSMEIVGTSLPSRLFLTKALVVPVVAFVCLMFKAPRVVTAVRVTAPDIAVGLFCLSPLLASLAGKIPAQQGLIQVGYLTGVWGCTWTVGRFALADAKGRRGLALAILASGLGLFIPTVLESFRPAWIYAAVYGPHPFMFSGVSRYLGFRPLAFFEDGNQYGMWICMAALVSLHIVLVERARSRRAMAVAAVLTLCALASQSVGAILLLIAGCGFMVVPPRTRRGLVIGAALILATGGLAYVSGKVPLRSWALETPSGRALNRMLKAVNRGSLGWRVQRDQKSLQLIHQSLVVGHGTWDWWRPVGSHPWGLPLLIAGQFGCLALACAGFALLWGAVRDIWRGSRGVLPVIVVLAMIDSWLNSTAYLPALLASAALAVPIRRRSAEPHDDRADKVAAPVPDLEKANG